MTDWLEIRRAYEAGGKTVAQVCEQFQISTRQLYDRARVEQWKKRHARKRSDYPARTKKKAVASMSAAQSHEIDQKELIDRLYTAFEKQMSEFEAQHISTADEGINEKDAGTLVD